MVHLDLVEDAPRRSGRAPPHDYKWRYGIVDGERVPRDHLDPTPVDVRSSHRDDDDNQRGCHECQGDN